MEHHRMAHEFRMAAPTECHCTCGWRPKGAPGSTPDELWADYFLQHVGHNIGNIWYPNLGILNWYRNEFNRLRDGGIFRTTRTVYQVFRSRGLVQMMHLDGDPTESERTETIVWLMGWSFEHLEKTDAWTRMQTSTTTASTPQAASDSH